MLDRRDELPSRVLGGQPGHLLEDQPALLLQAGQLRAPSRDLGLLRGELVGAVLEVAELRVEALLPLGHPVLPALEVRSLLADVIALVPDLGLVLRPHLVGLRPYVVVLRLHRAGAHPGLVRLPGRRDVGHGDLVGDGPGAAEQQHHGDRHDDHGEDAQQEQSDLGNSHDRLLACAPTARGRARPEERAPLPDADGTTPSCEGRRPVPVAVARRP